MPFFAQNVCSTRASRARQNLRKMSVLVEPAVFRMRPQLIAIEEAPREKTLKTPSRCCSQHADAVSDDASPGQITCNFQKIREERNQLWQRRRQIKQLLKCKKSEEEIENSVRAKAIRHLIRLGNLLRHGDRRKMASPDHRDLLAAIGSENSVTTTRSLTSASNLSSGHFNLCFKPKSVIVEELPG